LYSWFSHSLAGKNVTFALDHIDGGFAPALPDRRQSTRVAAGIALSLAAHALLLAIYRQPVTTLPSAPPERLTIRLQAAPETPAPPSAPATTTQHFDLDAARSMARGMAAKLATEPDPDKVGTALERLPKPPLQTENKFERAIKGAKRADCKDGVPGGLLAPIFLAMDKKDSGCKW
jgi:hypothetical protein